jgi:hypothetical protein
MTDDIAKLRNFLQYGSSCDISFLVGAMKREYLVIISYRYLKNHCDFEHVFMNWSLTDASIWALDVLKNCVSILTAGEILAVINMMLEEMCANN